MNLKPVRSRSIGHHRGESRFTFEVTFPGTALLRLQNWKRPHNAQGEREREGREGRLSMQRNICVFDTDIVYHFHIMGKVG